MTTWKLISLFIAITISFICITLKAASAYEVIPVETGGSISGNIKFNDPIPASEVLNVNKNREYCGNTVLDNSLIVNPENRGIQNVIVSLVGIDQGKKHLPETIVLDNNKCHFMPRILGGVVGDSIEIRNSDPILHNTHLLYSEVSTFLNAILVPKGNNIKQFLKTTGIVKIKCDAHRFMRGKLLVFDHPYFSITDSMGDFKITDVPSGQYKVRIWHETLPEEEKMITISPQQDSILTLELKLN
ncbi:MAG: hypothetical protein HY200_01810 [Nitrospirae bacterium]|nr:hypothetical protein [Nitrospirota bacterium]MBI3593671.1 hypothetical protein [Nitrospirota bacterium]